MPKHTLDGLAVTAACIARGMDIQLYPDQVLIASLSQDKNAMLSFVQGVPDSVSLSEITFLQERPMRRNLHQRAGIPVPAGTSFTLRRGIPNGRAFVEKVGFPVTLKPATGSATTEISPRIDNWDDFDAAIAALQESPEMRPGYVQMLAGPVNTNWPSNEAGTRTPPPNYRVVVEQHISGEYIRLLVINGEMKSAVHCAGGPWGEDPATFSDVTESVSDSIADLATRAVRIFPRIPIAAVDIVVDDHKLELDDQTAHVLEISERPWLYVQRQISTTLFESFADAIVRQTAASYEVTLPSQEPLRDVAFSVSGLRGSRGSNHIEQSWLDLGKRLSLTGWLEPLDGSHAAGDVRGRVQGAPLAIATLSESLVGGHLDGFSCISFTGSHLPTADPPTASMPIG